jgi:hypothetical protein
LAWVAITWAAAPHDTPLALCTLAMAAWHLGTFAFLVRDRAPRAVLAVALTLGWLQAFAFAPLWWHDEGIALWWLAMATVAAALVCWRPQWGAVRLWIAPGLGVLGWSLAHEGDPIGLVLGLSAAAGLLVAAAWPKPLEPAVPAEAGLLPEGHRALVWVTAVAGFFAWAFAAHVHLRWPDIQGVPLLVAVPVLAWVVGAAWRPSPVRGQVAIGACIVALGAFGLDADARDTLSLLGPEVGGRLLPGLALALLVAAAVGLVAALRRHAGRRHAGDVLAEAAAAIHDAAGIITAVAIALLAMLTWVAVAPLLTPDLFVAASLLQVGWSVALAAVALGLVVVGLRRDRSTWRRLGIAALFAVAGKVVFVDLAAVALAWRVVSFVGLGACLIAGAWAYGRFEKRLAPSDLAGDPRA